MLKGVDVSNNDDGLSLLDIDIDFAVIKATEGDYFKDDYLHQFARECKQKKIPFGMYHFARPNNPVYECDYFIEATKAYHRQALPVLDIEDESISNWTTYINNFCSRYYNKRGVWPVVYMSEGYLELVKSCKATLNCPLWVARYPTVYTNWIEKDYPYTKKPFNRVWLWQFTENLILDGYDGELDGDLAYISVKEWQEYAKGKTTPENSSKTPQKPNIKSVAYEVIQGKWGNGLDRKTKLEKAGYKYNEVQDEVNRIFNLAHRAMRGDYGNGETRRKKLGSYYEPVQYVINNILY